MRISDWSSDVCSSDLAPAGRRGGGDHAVELPQCDDHAQDRAGAGRGMCRGAQTGSADPAVGDRDRPARRARRGAARPSQHRSEERREGKSVSVRVDLGGSRIIKKTKTTKKVGFNPNNELVLHNEYKVQKRKSIKTS